MKPVACPGGKYEILAEINMIPFIDIALVLLIIFMIITPALVRSSIRVELPRAVSAETTAESQAVEVQIPDSGPLQVNGVATAPERLEAVLRALSARSARDGIVIHADRQVPFQRFVSVVDVARQAGIEKFGVAVRPEKGRAVRSGRGSPEQEERRR